MAAGAEPIQSILIGAGNRGAEVYGEFAITHPWLFRFSGVAESNPDRRAAFAHAHHIESERVVDDWRKALDFTTERDLVFICTPDRTHFEVASAFAAKGCTIVLEKPVVTNAADCAAFAALAGTEANRIIVCHVLRYTPFFSALKKVIEQGRISSVVSINLQENIAWYHFAHSYVRGNWRSEALSSPSILAKSVHDLDILYWLAGAPAETIVSMGELSWFKGEHAPEGATERCLDGCAHAELCPWYAPDLYLTDNTGWPTSVISNDHSLGARRRALETGPYGRCVYYCDNDVMDHQDVLIRFKNGVSASFSMNALTYDKTRIIQVRGSKGEIVGDLDEGWLEIHDFLRAQRERIELGASVGGHNGGDDGLMKDIAKLLRSDVEGSQQSRSSIGESLEGHWMAFAAEESRKTRHFVDFEEFKHKWVSTRGTNYTRRTVNL